MIDIETVTEEKSKILRIIGSYSGFNECCIPMFIRMMDIGTMFQKKSKILYIIRS